MTSPLTKKRIGIVGTGFLARNLASVLRHHEHLMVSSVLTRRDVATVTGMPVEQSRLTNSVSELIATSDLVVECSGDVIHGTDVIEQVFAAGLPVVTMNSELQVVTGTALARRGVLVEAEGDQPGSLAALDAEVRGMGFTPLVYGNIKRFLNLTPTPDEMAYWAKRQGISFQQVTSFTDGTKVQIEQALVANGLGAAISRQGLSGIVCQSFEDGAQRLARIADKVGRPLSDYVLSPTAPSGVFVVARHQDDQVPALEYLKMGTGPYYTILRPYHLCHLEVPRTIMRVLAGDSSYVFNNGQRPTVTVATVAKRAIVPGERLEHGIGSFVVRGEAASIAAVPDAVPIGLLQDAEFVRPVAEGSVVTFDDVRLPASRALELWRHTVSEVVGDSSGPSSGSTRRLPTVTVGVPAHNEEENITQILASIMAQDASSYILEKVIVACDGCTDDTVRRAQAFARRHPVVEVVIGAQRRGKAVRLNRIYEMNTSDVLVTFDADIALEGDSVIATLLRRLHEDSDTLVVAGNGQPLPGRTLVENVVATGERLWYEVRRDFRGGNTIYNSAGCVYALRKSFVDSLRFPADTIAEQHFVYLHALQSGGNFVFAQDAVVRYRVPGTISDFLKQARRSLSEHAVAERYFGDSIEDEYRVPTSSKVRAVFVMLFRYPVLTPLALLSQVVLRVVPLKPDPLHSHGMWAVAASTKRI